MRATMQKSVRQISQQQRMKSSGDGSHIPKDMKGNAETKIKKWLNEQGKKEVNTSDKNTTNTQKQQNNDICVIL
jgi:hypothetical protein